MVPSPSRRFRRIGEVTATHLQAAVEWRTTTGEVLRGRAGDWWVEGPDGVGRTVTGAEFQATYEPLGGDRYRRTGVVTARRVESEELVDTLEGPARAFPGMWIVTGPNGNSWPVPDEVFRQGYREI
jgi:hypothetical protein